MIYFDSAATTFPKPQGVAAEVDRCIRQYCGNPGRSGHYYSVESARIIYSCREKLAGFFNGRETNVVFTGSATEGLNLAMNAFHEPGSHIVISDIEHNAVLRPANALGEYSVFEIDPYSPENTVRSLKKAVRKGTSEVVVNHASNICGIVSPVNEIGAFCRENGIKFIIDASQSAGKLRLDLKECSADAMVFPGHKGLYGIQGCGGAVFADRYSGEGGKELSPFLFGGTGINSKDRKMPLSLPERFEAGTPPTPCIAGLLKGLEFVQAKTPEKIYAYEQSLCRYCAESLSENRDIRLFCKDLYSSCVLFEHKKYGCERVAEHLSHNGICVRAGLHCAPLAHEKIGSDGAVRVSFSVFNTKKEIDVLTSVLEKL